MSIEEYIMSELPGFKYAKNYWNSQESYDVAHWEREAEGMMENMEDIRKALLEMAGPFPTFSTIRDKRRFQQANNIFKIPDGDYDQKNLKATMEEIEKMDIILNMKVTEEKKAKLSRIQAEEESKDILTNLPCAKMSNGIKINLKEFLRLLNEAEKPQNDSSSFLKLNDLDGFEPDNCGEEKKEKISNHKFVERNIQLAKCGRGTLSLTDEEKLRIKNLLMDIEDSKEAERLKTENFHGNEKVSFAMDEEAKFILDQIDEKLEALTKEKRSPKEYQNKTNLSEKAEGEGGTFEESDKRKQNTKKKLNRLKEINKLLSSMNVVSNEEIIPLTEEEIGNLVRQSSSLFESERSCPAGEEEWPNSKLREEVIADLVSSAKLLMPKFKYRCYKY